MAKKVEICLKKKSTPSSNIPLLSYRKSEQLVTYLQLTFGLNQID